MADKMKLFCQTMLISLAAILKLYVCVFCNGLYGLGLSLKDMRMWPFAILITINPYNIEFFIFPLFYNGYASV